MVGWPTILEIDTNRRHLELMKQILEGHGYRVVTAFTLEAIDRHLLAGERIRLALSHALLKETQ